MRALTESWSHFDLSIKPHVEQVFKGTGSEMKPSALPSGLSEVTRHWNHHESTSSVMVVKRGPRHLNTNKGQFWSGIVTGEHISTGIHVITYSILDQHQARMYLHKLLLHTDDNCNFLMSEQDNCLKIPCAKILCNEMLRQGNRQKLITEPRASLKFSSCAVSTSVVVQA